MSVHLIVDGYNLIRQSPELRRLEAQDLEAGRRALLELLSEYRRTRPGRQVSVVFDGWQTGGFQESRDLYLGVGVIYSRRGERADEVIKRLLSRERGRAVVVSSDRELQGAARRVGAAWIEALAFALQHLFPHSPADQEGEGRLPGQGTTKKGPSRRPPKKERRRRQRLRKL
ncbi:MAG: hypothetical protein FJ128_05270 [Deltaproteobacteria bacterium]|nr:hypothetical protein [Deltaproteobacteria bacterium]